VTKRELTRDKQDEAVLQALYRRIRYECMEEAAYLVEQLAAEGYKPKALAEAVRNLTDK